MEKWLSWGCLALGCYTLLNGILHTVFVLAEKRSYDRELLRLLQDGHIIVFVGIFLIIAFFGLKQDQSWGYWVAGCAAVSMLIYCGLIFPFLKTVGMIAWHSIFLVWLVIAWFQRA